ncbi:MAG: class I SAM-dependent methyltransferase [Methylovulum sp.]|uniref:class I SAM-dependent methyltransferase n=1 Tax=Methylovulum sp. TaxID=1916980 RepID=UPI00260B79C7|nr:class I SAM-dependent methyltransferase [Methylovulum sp.]MDD2725319.1 class I SAM-dependent methyltransferase [Methylovulum sp.]
MLPPEVTIESIPCECGSLLTKKILAGNDWLNNLPGEFQVVQCRDCGLLRTNPRPTPDTIGFYYPDNYGPYLTTQVKQNHQPKKIKKGIKKWLSDHFNANSKTIIPDTKPGQLLEIGCGSGDFLMEMQQQGWEVQGLEPSDTATHRARLQGLEVTCGTLETTELPQNHFDMVVAWMVIEHLHHPLAGLEKICLALKPGGVLVLSVPDMGGLDFRLFKQHYYALHLPNHLYHFTRFSIKRLILDAGFRQCRFFWHRNPNYFFASLNHVFAIRQQPRLESFTQKVLDRKRLKLFSKLLGWLLALTRQSGRMTVWAYKCR